MVLFISVFIWKQSDKRRSASHNMPQHWNTKITKHTSTEKNDAQTTV